MKESFEKLTQMELATWISMMTVAICATIVRLVVEASNFSVREFLIGSLLAGFLAYLTALYCLEQEMSGKMMGVVVGFVTYQATNILTGLGRLGAAFAKDPIALVKRIKEAVKK